ncbi:hypothetical protein D081_1533 [Anaerovibrio sp. JC8]|uniref:hypothetical protein n=1 Tax=Anaerovibrio sp. JC8 TaxID=1240085 RepID=UPI000A0A8742|nr:hypothetical protein [Anaerovibrio sp. JC8]ORT99952.1 hypothetical protein D081_1533 [Anaerovibrio sp. JC8]
MKKKMIALVAGLTMTASAVCCAMISPEGMAISGVAPGSSVSDATAKLGNPQFAGDKIYFSNGIVIERSDYNPNLVEEIETYTAGNATPGGLQVGMPEASITATYGAPDKLDRDYDDTEYTYYSTDYFKKLEFKVVGGNIVKIKCKLRD